MQKIGHEPVDSPFRKLVENSNLIRSILREPRLLFADATGI